MSGFIEINHPAGNGSQRSQCKELLFDEYLRTHQFIEGRSHDATRDWVNKQNIEIVQLERDIQRCRIYSKHNFNKLILRYDRHGNLKL
jgi:hypothetical protein